MNVAHNAIDGQFFRQCVQLVLAKWWDFIYVVRKNFSDFPENVGEFTTAGLIFALRNQSSNFAVSSDLLASSDQGSCTS